MPQTIQFHIDENVNHVGIAYCAKGSRSIGEIVRGLILIWKILDPLDMQNQVEFL